MRKLLSLGLFLIAVLPAGASTIISTTGDTTNPFIWNLPVYVSWTQTGVTYSNVAITANLLSTSGTATGNAYLMNAAPPTTAASQLGSASPISITNTTAAPVTLFQNLTLGPGTYYLVIGNNNQLAIQSAAYVPSAVTLGTGVSGSVSAEDFSAPTYPPSGSFNVKNQVLFSVTGNLVGSVPALTLWGMLATAILLAVSGLFFVRKFRVAAE